MENFIFIVVVVVFGYIFFGPHAKGKPEEDKKSGPPKR